MITTINVLDCLHDERLFKQFFDGDLSTWRSWQAALACLYGTPVQGIRSKSVIKKATGRLAATIPQSGFDVALFLCGRRSGKSKIVSAVAGYEALFGEGLRRLSPGEQAMVAVISPSKAQSGIIRKYLRGLFRSAPALEQEVADEQREGFTLRNGVRIQVLSGDWRLVRGFTLLACVLDEVCFFQSSEEMKQKSDKELINAVLPALSTTNGKLVAISSVYARKGWAHETWKRHWGMDQSDTLVWLAPSRLMNPTLPQSVVERALREDLAAARAEYLSEWRDDVSSYLPRDVIESCVIPNRTELLPNSTSRYSAFVDVSGGRHDDAALAIAHKEGDQVVIDFARAWKPPLSPEHVVAEMAQDLRRYEVRHVTGDAYGAEWVSQTFRRFGIRYRKADRPKAQLYLELLPLITSKLIELPDNTTLVTQLAALERRTRSGGRDIIDHPRGHHDDLANAVAGAAALASNKSKRVLGTFGEYDDEPQGRGKLINFLIKREARVL